MRSDLARAPVNLQPPQRPGLDDYKKPSSGSYTGLARQSSAGRKTPQGKIVLPEFPRRTALGSGGSYASLGAAGRSTSVPRPSSRSGGVNQITSGSNSSGGSSHVATAAAAAAATPSAAHNSPRGAAPRAPLPGPGSILDALATPSVLPGGGTRASLAQRMNSSSVMDYGTLAGGTSSSIVRIKRQAGSVSGDTITAVAPGAPPGAPSPHYTSLVPSADQLRGIYMPSPAAGTSACGGGVVPVATSANVGGPAVPSAGRRASMERSAVERIVSRANSFSSQNGGSYNTGPGGPPSPVGGNGLSSSMVAAAPPPLAASSSASSYHSAVDQPSRLASGSVVYASQYAHQYGSQTSTVYIPNFSQHPPPGGGLYGSTGGGNGHYAQPPRPTPLSNSSAAPLPPVVLSPSATGSPQGSHPPLIGSSVPTSSAAQHYHHGSAEYAARNLQRSASTSLSGRPIVGAAAGTGGTATTGGAGRLRALSIAPNDDDRASADAGSNSSLRRIQSQDDQPRRSGNGAAAAAGGQHVTVAPAVATTPKPVVSVAAAASADYHLPAQSHTQHPQPQVTQQPHHYQYPQQQQQQQHIQHPTSQFHPHGHGPHPHPVGGVGASAAGPTGAALDSSGNSYTSNASSNTSNGGSSSAHAVSNGGGSSSKSSVAAAGTGVSSASTSRTTSSISQRSAADALAAHVQAHGTQGTGRQAASTGLAGGQPLRSGQRPTAAVASAADGSARSSCEAPLGSAMVRTQSGPTAASGMSLSPHSGHGEGVTACGPLPDLPLVIAPRDAAPGRGCVGLQNLGNTCFMNSILQSLNAVPELVQQFLNPSEKHWSSKAVVAPAYSGLVRDMISGTQGTCVNPAAFLRKVSKHDGRWGDGRQQDSQEFLNSLLEALQAECNRIRVKPVYRELQGKGSEEAQAAEAYDYARTWNDSIVDDIFGGLTQSTIQCYACKRLSHTFEPFLGLAVPIPGSGSSADSDGGSVSVADCLRAFVECEELQGDDSYKCEACKRRQPHSKRMQIFRPPRVLVLTLKRFAQRPAAPGLFNRFRSPAKNNTPVRLDPEPLDLTPYCNPLGLRGLCVRGRGPVVPLYELVAVSHHSGSLEGGHYTAQARSCLDGQWYNFNDSCVRREPGRPSGSSSSAYVLFYRLANLQPPFPASSNL